MGLQILNTRIKLKSKFITTHISHWFRVPRKHFALLPKHFSDADWGFWRKLAWHSSRCRCFVGQSSSTFPVLPVEPIWKERSTEDALHFTLWCRRRGFSPGFRWGWVPMNLNGISVVLVLGVIWFGLRKTKSLLWFYWGSRERLWLNWTGLQPFFPHCWEALSLQVTIFQRLVKKKQHI